MVAKTGAAARQAWNDAMRATAGATALPPALQQSNASGAPGSAIGKRRRSDRRSNNDVHGPDPSGKKGVSMKDRVHHGEAALDNRDSQLFTKTDRRKQARKPTALGLGNSSTLDQEDVEYESYLLLDALEGIDPSLVNDLDGVFDGGGDEDDDEYDVVDDLEDSQGDVKRSRSRRSQGNARNRSKSRASLSKAFSKSSSTASTTLPKHLHSRSLASILMEERNRSDGSGVASQFVTLEHPLPIPQRCPRRRFCPVTNQKAAYRDTKTGIPYAANRRHALDQIQERPPPWISNSGTAAYYEVVKSLQESHSDT